jgi:hypothetical protein
MADVSTADSPHGVQGSLSSTGPVAKVLFAIESSSESFQLAIKSPRPLELFSSEAVHQVPERSP